jgi:hypothetical protein
MRFVAVQQTSSAPQAPPGGKAPVQNTFWIVLAVLLLGVTVLLPRLRRRRPPPASDRPGAFRDAEELARSELERLLADLQDISREQIARLDTKIRLLNQLLLDCDQKKKEIEELLEHRVGAGHSKVAPPPPPRPSLPLHDQVYSLQDAGKDVSDICGATGLEKGEVELILGLRKMPPAK